MTNAEELYEGFSMGKTYRDEAAQKFGKKAVEHSEKELMKLGKKGFEQLKSEFESIWQNLFEFRNEDPTSIKVQVLIEQHYQSIREFWGTSHKTDPQIEAYRGLGQMYVADKRFTSIDGVPHPEFASFLNEAIGYYVKTKFKI